MGIHSQFLWLWPPCAIVPVMDTNVNVFMVMKGHETIAGGNFCFHLLRLSPELPTPPATRGGSCRRRVATVAPVPSPGESPAPARGPGGARRPAGGAEAARAPHYSARRTIAHQAPRRALDPSRSSGWRGMRQSNSS